MINNNTLILTVTKFLITRVINEIWLEIYITRTWLVHLVLYLNKNCTYKNKRPIDNLLSIVENIYLWNQG